MLGCSLRAPHYIFFSLSGGPLHDLNYHFIFWFVFRLTSLKTLRGWSWESRKSPDTHSKHSIRRQRSPLWYVCVPLFAVFSGELDKVLFCLLVAYCLGGLVKCLMLRHQAGTIRPTAVFCIRCQYPTAAVLQKQASCVQSLGFLTPQAAIRTSDSQLEHPLLRLRLPRLGGKHTERQWVGLCLHSIIFPLQGRCHFP